MPPVLKRSLSLPAVHRRESCVEFSSVAATRAATTICVVGR
jgi:hypothetical protein